MRLERTATGIRLILGATVREVGIPPDAHVAITRQGSNWFIWVNGSLADSFSTNYPIPRKAATIGPVDTVLDEIRLTRAALYTVPFTPPEVPHQAWYQGNPIFARGQITQGLEPIGGQIAGSKGSITEGSVLPNAQTGGSKGQILQGRPPVSLEAIFGQRQFAKGLITDGSVLLNAQVGGVEGSLTDGSVLPNAQVGGSEGSLTDGSALPNAQVGGSEGSIADGSVLPNAQAGGSKGQILQGNLAVSPAAIFGQNAGAKGFVTGGEVVVFGIYLGQRQFAKGSILQGKRLILGDRWSKGSIAQGTIPDSLSLPPPLTGAIPSQQQYAKKIPKTAPQSQKITGWIVRFLQKEEGEVVPAVSLGGDLAVTPEGQQLRGLLLPNRDPEPGEPLLVTGTPGNYLMDALSWDPAYSAYSAYSASFTPTSAFSPVTLDSQRRCGLCATVNDFYTENFESQRRGILPGWYTRPGGSRVFLARRVPEGVQSVKVGPEQGLGFRDHSLMISVYSYEECLQRDRQVGFWARGRFAVPFPEPFHAVVLVKIRLDEENWWFSPGWFQSMTVDISIAPDGSWQATWQGNPRRPSGGRIQPDPDPSTRTGVFSVWFRFPSEADLATLVELEMCFGNAGLRRINE